MEITNGSSPETVALHSVGEKCQDIHKNIFGVQCRYFRYAVFPIRQTGDIVMKKRELSKVVCLNKMPTLYSMEVG